MKLFLVILLFIIFTAKASAQEYVLPYPGTMPGNKLYIISQIKEKIDEVLYFGNFSKYTFYLKQSDKYLVEAKVLFEYKQYLLGNSALEKSNMFFLKTGKSLENARKEGKDISQKTENLNAAKQKHIEVLRKIKKEVPESFEWTPEKESPTFIKLWEEIDKAILIRK